MASLEVLFIVTVMVLWYHHNHNHNIKILHYMYKTCKYRYKQIILEISKVKVLIIRNVPLQRDKCYTVIILIQPLVEMLKIYLLSILIWLVWSWFDLQCLLLGIFYKILMWFVCKIFICKVQFPSEMKYTVTQNCNLW